MNDMDWILPFTCLPPSNENEWLNLSDFIHIYNSTYGKNYLLESFPENENRSTPEPEILLRDGDSRMVIERKIFPFPAIRVREHQLWHEFSKRIFERLSDILSEDLYALEIKNIDLPNNKKEIGRLVDRITNDVLRYEQELKASEEIFLDGKDDPHPWRILRVSRVDREEAPFESGLCIRLIVSPQFYDAQKINNSVPQVQRDISRIIQRSIPKFENYSDCIRILILEPYTDVLNFLSDIFVPAMQPIEIPKNIDQIWLAGQVELNDWESVLDYRLIKSSEKAH